MTDLKEALSSVPSFKDIPIIRQCCDCKSWLDEASEMISKARPNIEYIISHGYCKPCGERLEAELDRDELAGAQTLRSNEIT